MHEVAIRIVNKSANPLPSYATGQAAGMDIRADLGEPVILGSLERTLIPTGLFLEIPQGYEAQIRPRSGLAAKQGLTCLNSPGTIDSDYRGEIKVILVNLGKEQQVIRHGDRIAQMIISKVAHAILNAAIELDETERGTGGFGHTGSN